MKLTQIEIAKFWMTVKIDYSSKIIRTSKKQFGHCWVWQGSFSRSGYGIFFSHQNAYRAHRVAFIITHGPIPEDKLICHTCDNPSCVNPEHLWIGSSQENTHDMIKKGRLCRNRSNHKDSISKYPGVSFRKEKKTNPWRARLMRNYKTIWCKEFATEEEAHIARSLQLEILSSCLHHRKEIF